MTISYSIFQFAETKGLASRKKIPVGIEIVESQRETSLDNTYSQLL